MKVVFPKHIQKGMLAGMSFSIGPITLSIIQLFLIAIWVAAGFGVFNTVSKSGSKAMWIIAGVPIIAIFLIIAFFKVSELWLVPFIAKMVRNNFFDTSKKFQTNYERFNPITIMIQKTKIKEKKQAVQRKEEINTDDLVGKLDNSGFL